MSELSDDFKVVKKMKQLADEIESTFPWCSGQHSADLAQWFIEHELESKQDKEESRCSSHGEIRPCRQCEAMSSEFYGEQVPQSKKDTHE